MNFKISSKDYTKYNNDDIYVKSSNIHGLVLFSKNKIEKNTLIVKCRYCVIPKDILEKNINFSEEEIDFIKSKSVLPFFNYICSIPLDIIQNKKQEIFISFLGNISFINKTDNIQKENVTFILSNEGDYKNIFLFSTKDIQPEEELVTTYDLENISYNSNINI